MTMVMMMMAAVAQPALPGPATPFDWTAYPSPGEAVLVNPACLAFQPGLLVSAGFVMSDSTFERFDQAVIALPGQAFSGYWNDDENMRVFTTSSALSIIDGSLSLGAGYTWYDPVTASPLDGKGRWTFGIAARPSPAFGLGIVRRGGLDAGGTEFEPRYRAGAAVRPLGDMFTITADYETDQSFDDGLFSAGAEIRPLEGMTLRFDGSEEGFSLGLRTDFGHLGLGGAASFGDDGSYAGSRGSIALTSLPRGSLVPRRDRFVRIEPGTFSERRGRVFLGPSTPSFTENVLQIERITSDPSVAGVIVDLSSGAGTPAQAEEVREILLDIRRTGRQVWVWMPSGGNTEVYLASAGTSIMSHPSGEVGYFGLAFHNLFLRDMLDRIGIYPDLVHIGEYKSASEMLTRSDMSEYQREAETALLTAFEDHMNMSVGMELGLEPATLRAVIQGGPMPADEAVNAGLVDGILFGDELEERIEADLGRSVTIEDLGAYSGSHPVYEAWGPVDHVAVVVATGLIVQGESGSMFPLGETMGSETIAGLVDRAVSEPGVRALVLRIDSGGGDAFASEDMLHALQEAGERMPVVVSMGAVAGSGGYYIACCGDSIFADNLTITGSIGVISGKLVFGGLLERLGVNTETVSRWPMADMGSIFSPYSEEQAARIEYLTRHSYELFASRVGEARGMTFEEVDAIGRGRVWAGADAVRIGLVDRIGGVADAIRSAATMAGLPRDWVPVVTVHPTPGLFEGFGLNPFGSLGSTGVEDALQRLSRLQGNLFLMQPVLVE